MREAYFDQQRHGELNVVVHSGGIVADFFEVESQRSAWHQEGYVRPLRESALGREFDTLKHE